MKMTKSVFAIRMESAKVDNNTITMDQVEKEIELINLRKKHGMNRSYFNPNSQIVVKTVENKWKWLFLGQFMSQMSAILYILSCVYDKGKIFKIIHPYAPIAIGVGHIYLITY